MNKSVFSLFVIDQFLDKFRDQSSWLNSSQKKKGWVPLPPAHFQQWLMSLKMRTQHTMHARRGALFHQKIGHIMCSLPHWFPERDGICFFIHKKKKSRQRMTQQHWTSFNFCSIMSSSRALGPANDNIQAHKQARSTNWTSLIPFHRLVATWNITAQTTRSLTLF